MTKSKEYDGKIIQEVCDYAGKVRKLYESLNIPTTLKTSELKPLSGKWPITQNGMLYIAGAVGSGKSHFIKEFLSESAQDAIIFVGSPTVNLDVTDPYKHIGMRVNKFTSAIEAIEGMMDYIHERYEMLELLYYADMAKNKRDKDKALEELEDYDREYLSPKHSIFIIIDDSGKEFKYGKDLFDKLVILRRHMYINIILSVQRYTFLNKDDRMQITDLLITSKVSSDDVKIMHEQLDATCSSLKYMNLKHVEFARLINYYNQKLEETGSEYISWLFSRSGIFLITDDGGTDEITQSDLQMMVQKWRNS